MPGNPAGAIYGTIVTAGLVVPTGEHHEVYPTALLILGTVAGFWIAHAYTDLLGGVIERGTVETTGLGHALRVEWPIVESALLPLTALLITHWVGASDEAAAEAALVVAVLELLGWAWLATRRANLPVRKRLPYLLVSAVLGIAIIVLKAALH